MVLYCDHIVCVRTYITLRSCFFFFFVEAPDHVFINPYQKFQFYINRYYFSFTLTDTILRNKLCTRLFSQITCIAQRFMSNQPVCACINIIYVTTILKQALPTCIKHTRHPNPRIELLFHWREERVLTTALIFGEAMLVVRKQLHSTTGCHKIQNQPASAMRMPIVYTHAPKYGICKR